MARLCGIDMQSQAAFELAAQGVVRPLDRKIPMIYSIKCIDFMPPEFTLGKHYTFYNINYQLILYCISYIYFLHTLSEVVSINENDMYLKSLIHDLGMQLHSVAMCTQIQCFQYALFDLNLALLKKHWDVRNILDNIEQCHAILRKNRKLLKQDDPILKEYNN